MRPTEIRQGYLNDDPDRTVRIRLQKGDKSYITIKGRPEGIRRSEYEYEIPEDDALEMYEMCKDKVEKIRYNHGPWEIDVFERANEGLIVAEIELFDEDEKFNKPWWLGEEVSDKPKYFNSLLSVHPWKTWKNQ